MQSTYIQNAVNFIVTAVVNNYDVKKVLNDEVEQSEGVYSPKAIQYGDDLVSFTKATLFNKWLATSIMLLSHTLHSARSDDYIGRQFNVGEYNVIPAICELSKVTEVKLVRDSSMLTKPLYSFDVSVDDNMAMSPVEYNSYQQTIINQVRDVNKTQFKDLKPLSFSTISLDELSCIYLADQLKLVSRSNDTTTPVVILHVSADLDPDMLDSARPEDVKEVILSYANQRN